jgi:hypothetical protein
MALPTKGTRKLLLDEKTYLWRVGKIQPEQSFANLVVESPEGEIWTRRVKVRREDGAPKSVTTKDVVEFVRSQLR